MDRRRTKWKTRKRNSRIASDGLCPILCHYVLTSLFEMFDQGNHRTEFHPCSPWIWNCICCVIWGYRSIGNAVFCVSFWLQKKKGKQDESGFWTVFLVSRELVIWIGCGFFILSLMFGRGFFRVYIKSGEMNWGIIELFLSGIHYGIENLSYFSVRGINFRNQKNTRIALVVTGISTVVNLWF